MATDILVLFVLVLAAIIVGVAMWIVRGMRTALSDERAALTATRLEIGEMKGELGRRAEAEARATQLASALETAQRAERGQAARIAELNTLLEQERAGAAEKIELLGRVREDMENRFKALADETMRRHGESFKASNIEGLNALLAPFRENVSNFQNELKTANTEATKERIALKTEIEQLTKRSEQVSREAVNLTRALKGDQQRQGAWGEMILESLLERSGLREGEEYETQTSHTDEDGKRRRPDVIINLPGEKKLIVDSKVSLVAYERLVNAETEEDRSAALSAHVLSLRNHINDLSGKDYHRAFEGGLDYVIMFVAIEGALSEALKAEGDLTAYAAEKGVAIATPTTLMMSLRTIEHVWTVERRNVNAEKIADRAGRLYDKFAGFADAMGQVGDRLDQAQKAHSDAMSRLSTGRGNVMSQVDQLKAMGARTNKTLKADFESDTPKIEN
ncbi:MAG: DNA recombination protein RmuC [Pikeienuella sp.]